MKWEAGTVFVLGAGFTKAFVPSAPLLVDDYDGDELEKVFAGFREALAVLRLERSHPDHKPGYINLERLMTRLAGGMPYDFHTRAEKPLGLLLSELKTRFTRRLSAAMVHGKENTGELALFAKHCIRHQIDCITFNYDDLLDEALWDTYPAWTPDWGYGFPCRMSETLVEERSPRSGSAGSTRLIKLHGSLNWRIPRGQHRPYAAEVIRHHEAWLKKLPGRASVPLERIELLLEPDPFIVPPVLTKADLAQEPLLQLTWYLAAESLKKAKHVVFIGYSLPPTDIAAAFLFREGLQHLDPRKDVIVVDLAREGAEATERTIALTFSYEKVFPGIWPNQYFLGGAVQWIRDNLTDWLFDSKGQARAFRVDDVVVSRSGQAIGSVMRYYKDRFDTWNTAYQGEIVNGNRFLYKVDHDGGTRGPVAVPRGGLPGVPTIPRPIEPIVMPEGFRDVEWPD